MAKGIPYRLVEVEGCRRLCIPLSLWPALTGIISDNEFQFQPDCWAAMKEEIINMPVCGSYGWDGSAWRKLPMVWGYSDHYAQVIGDATMPAGSSNLMGSIVPAGEVWRVTGATLMVISESCTELRFLFMGGGSGILVASQLSPMSLQYYSFAFDVTLKAGDYVYGRFENMTLNDGAVLYVWGYKMKVAE